MSDKIKCSIKGCPNRFEPKTYRHRFCSRKCFLKHFRESQKESRFPSYICHGCKKTTQLDFFPKMNTRRWEEYECTLCGEKRLKLRDEYCI